MVLTTNVKVTKMNFIQAVVSLRNVLASLKATDHMFHLDDSPSEFDCFTATEAEELSAELTKIRKVLGEKDFWKIAENYM